LIETVAVAAVVSEIVEDVESGAESAGATPVSEDNNDNIVGDEAELERKHLEDEETQREMEQREAAAILIEA